MNHQEIVQSLKKIVEAPLLKGVLTFLGWVLQHFFGPPDAALKAFLTLLLVDLVTGLVKAEIRNEAQSIISHEKGRRKYIGYAMVIMVGQLLDAAAVPGLRNIVLIWGSATEARSIVENMELMGVPMPAFIREHLRKAESKFDVKKEEK